jgi:drug/metabolite transporter (DMT)-like permease
MSRRGWVLFAAMSVIWGIPYLMIKVAVSDLAPATLVFGRTAIGALLLLPVALTGRRLHGLRAAWLPLAAYTVVEICAPWLLLSFAETRLPSSACGLLLPTVPLVGAVLTRWTGDRERLGVVRIGGLLIGLAGVAAMVGLRLGPVDVTAFAALGVVAVAYAVGPVILARRLGHLPGLGVAAASLVISALVNLPAGIAEAPHHWPPARVLAAVGVLGAVCTALAFVLFLRLVAEAGPARATVITYLNPTVAIMLGVLVLGEPFTAAIGVGFVLVLAGSVLATSRSRTGAGRAATRPATTGPRCRPEAVTAVVKAAAAPALGVRGACEALP